MTCCAFTSARYKRVATVTGVVTVGLSFSHVTKAHSQEIAGCGCPLTKNKLNSPMTDGLQRRLLDARRLLS
jgi:hypothetical protein